MPIPAEGISLPAQLIVCAILLAGTSGIPEIFLWRRHGSGLLISAIFMGLAAILGGSGALLHLLEGVQETVVLDWPFPFGDAELRFDPLATLFMLPIFLVGGAGACYAVGYWPAGRHRASDVRITLAWGVLVAAMALVVLAGNTAFMLMAWELMALSAFFALTANDRDGEVRRAGLLYLIATHLGTLVLFVMGSLLFAATGNWQIPPPQSIAAGAPLATAIMVTGLLGFGAKAGIMPFHVWLPSAHANAPSHVSAIMSGVILKMGIYGIIRLLSLFRAPPLWWGMLLLALGVVSGVIGVMYALGQHDIKRLLAYHSIENIGIIAIGIGLSLVGRTMELPALTMLGMAGALLHTINHATFKSLLFFAAGSAIHATATRDIDRMGGIARQLPATSACFLIGAVAICGLPPLNGFISEFVIYLAAFTGLNDITGWVAAACALAAPALALIGALAVACFTKLYGCAFLGLPRTEPAGEHHPTGPAMIAPMILLATVCIVIGIFPAGTIPLLERAAQSLAPTYPPMRLNQLAPMGWLAIGNGIFLLLLALMGTVTLRRLRTNPVSTAPTWDCGYLAGTPRMQYTASSFAEMLVKLNQIFLRTDRHLPQIRGTFPAGSRFVSHVPEVMLEHCYLPFLARAQQALAPLRKLQGGQLHLYVLYLLLTLLILLIWSDR